jgi:sugar-phosphatase
MMPLLAAALLFDLDGVLADSTPSVTRAWSAWARRVGLDPDELLPKVHGRRAIETIRAARPDLDAEAELATIVADEATDNDDTDEIPGARALVSGLPADAWAIVTSGLRPVATARLVAARIPLPRVMITAESIERGKPNPDCYLAGAAALGVDPRDCVVVEDAPAGAAAARAGRADRARPEARGGARDRAHERRRCPLARARNRTESLRIAPPTCAMSNSHRALRSRTEPENP